MDCYTPLANKRLSLTHTDAEWEYAARGGKHQSPFEYSGSDDIDSVAWYGSNSNSRTHPVKRLKRNALGLYDMSGNVWEWCNDWYGESDLKEIQNPRGEEKGSSRVIRGGSWSNSSSLCRVSYRLSVNPSDCNDNIGFRCVRYD